MLRMQERLNQLEAELAQSRNKMNLGYTDQSSGEFKRASSVQLRNTMRTNDNEATRKACYEVSYLKAKAALCRGATNVSQLVQLVTRQQRCLSWCCSAA